MNYKILETIVNGDTTTTIVEYNIEGVFTTVSIPHFKVKSENDIALGITNRYITERRKLFPELYKDEFIIKDEPILPSEEDIDDSSIDGFIEW